MINIIKMTPEQLGYTDRGIVKWLGMMLSDHSEALKKESRKNQFFDIQAKPEMTEEEVSNVLYHAFVKKYPVVIQANIIKEGYYYKDVACKISGYAEDKIYLLLKDGRTLTCSLPEIRNIELMDQLAWYQKEV